MSVLLPGKQVPLESSLIGQAADFYTALPSASSVARAWAVCRTEFESVTFERFTLMLDVLYALRLLDLDEGIIVKLRSANAS